LFRSATAADAARGGAGVALPRADPGLRECVELRPGAPRGRDAPAGGERGPRAADAFPGGTWWGILPGLAHLERQPTALAARRNESPGGELSRGADRGLPLPTSPSATARGAGGAGDRAARGGGAARTRR